MITVKLSQQDLSDFLNGNVESMNEYVAELNDRIVDYFETNNVEVYYSQNELVDKISIDGEPDEDGIILELMSRMVQCWDWLTEEKE